MTEQTVPEILRHRFAAPLLLIVVAVLVYANSFPGAFILDDLHIAKYNPLVTEFNLVKIFISDYWHQLENSGLYRPLTTLSLALNRLLLGESVWGYHLVNVLLHAGVTILLWRVLCAWGATNTVAYGAALVFAVHPIHTQVVNEVVGRSELLVALFLLLAFCAARTPGLRCVVLTGACYLAALLSKEHAVTFLALLPVCDAFGSDGWRVWRKRWKLYTTLALIAAAWLWWREFGVSRSLPRSLLTEAAAPLAYVDSLTRVLTAMEHQWLYLWKMLATIGLQAVYSVADLPGFSTELFSLRALVVLLATGAVLALLVWGAWRRQPLALFGILYVISFSPTSNILFPIGVTMAERLAYFPSVWFCAGLATAWGLVTPRLPARLGVAIPVCYLLLLGVVTIDRNRAFASELHLWQAEVQQNPEDFLGWQSLAESLANQRRLAEAEEAYLRMLALAPEYPGGLRSRTAFLLRAHRHAEALPVARKVYEISQSRGDRIGQSFDSLDLAEVYLGLGEGGQALAWLERASELLSFHSRYQELLGKGLVAGGRHAEAVEAFAKVQVILPDSDIRYYFGLGLFNLGRLDEALFILEQDVEQRQAAAESWNLLGAVRFSLDRFDEAVVAFERAAALQPDNVYYQENFREARLRTGP